MANLFSGVKDPLIQGTGTITDYTTTADERFASEWEGALDQNPLAQGARMVRYAVEANAPFFGLESNMVSPEVAKEELKSRGLEGHITVPEGGMSRVEFDSIQYLKQRELSRQAKSAMNQSTFAHIAGFAGGLVGSAVDPINIASAFVPIVPEARIAAMLGKAGASTLGRAAVRAQVGATEGVVGALMIEPFTYAMSQYEQMDYTPADSFMNVVFGGLLGGGLHMAGGAVYDWRATRALNSLQRGLDSMNMRDMAPDVQDEVQLDILRRFTEAEENGTPLPDADEIIAQRMTPDQRSAVKEADEMPGEVPTPTRVDGETPQPRGLNELIPEAKADRTAETFNRQFLDKEQGDVSGFYDVRPPREDIFEVAQANFAGMTQHTAKTVPIDQLSGGVSTDPAETKRVNNLVELMSGPNGYLERLIVDTEGNVIEGQHRLEALRKMGIKEVPVIEIRDLREGLPVDQMMDAMRQVRGLHREQAGQIVDQIAEAIADVGSVAEVRAQYAPPRGFERAWEAALNAAEAADDLKAQSAPAKDASGKFTEAFWRWFKDSKVVDADGNPLVVYHGTDAYIEAFDPRMRGSVTGTSDAKVAFWFTASEARARAAANEAMEVSGTNLPAHDEGLIKVYLSLQNPKIITQDIREMLPSQSARLIRKAQRDGHDGVIFEKGEGGLPDYAVFEPTKIKSADRNRGTYDPELADIRAQSDEDYRGQHQAPTADGGAPLHDLTGGGSVYPDDVYGPKAVQYYGTGNEAMDRKSFSIAMQFKGNPNAGVTIYRAVPHKATKQERIDVLETQMRKYQARGVVPDGATLRGSAWYNDAYDRLAELKALPDDASEKIAINPGDWVTINRDYAKEHGESALNGEYKIISKRVKAKQIYTAGDSIHEWGYDPVGIPGELADIRAQSDIVDDAAGPNSGLTPYQTDLQKPELDLGIRLLTRVDASPGIGSGSRTLADELGFGDLKMMGEPLDPADGPDAPKVIGTDAAGRPVLDFRNSVVSHFTDQESADNINEFGYRVVGDGYYGEAISFTPNREFGAQFGGVETTARISPDARILNTGVPEDAQMIQSVLNNRHLVPNNPRPGLRSWRQEFLRLGIDGVYDPGAGDLFIYNERVVRPTAMDGLDDLKTMIGGERAAPDTPEFKRWFGGSKVVDANGKPLVVYHGGRAGIEKFANPDGKYKSGIFFTDSKGVANAFGRGGETYEMYLRIERPFEVDAKGEYYSSIQTPKQMQGYATTKTVDTDLIAKWAFENGYDGVVFHNVLEGRGSRLSSVYAVSTNTQIKSATDNSGNYDPDLADIRAQSDIIDKFQSDLDEQPDLVAAHNLTAANLLHADRMGGIAAPSLAIAKASDGHEGYGEITLIGSKDLVDPQKGANVYAGDIYSARYPTVHYNIKYDSIRKLDKQFAATAKEMGVTLRDTLDDDALEREGPRALENSVGALLSYAKEKGVKVDGYVFDRSAWEIRNNEAQARERAIRDEWQAKRDEEQQRAQAEGRDPDETALDAEMQPKYMEARREANSILREPDRALDEIKYKLRDKFRNDSGFAEWAEGKFAELKAKERIFKGFSNTTGAKMYTAHTLDNVVKLMTKKIRDAEGFNYGIGNLRAKVAPKFRSVEAIRGRKGSLVKREEFDAIKKEADAELISIADQLLPKLKYKGNSFGQLDALTQHMAEAVDRNNVKRVLQEYYNGITDDDVRMVGNFLQKLKSMPTTYFEAKLDRAVQIGEFEAAIVPNTLSKKAREVLERSGVKQIIEYDPAVDGSRQAAIDRMRDMKFQMDNDLRNVGFYSALERALTDAPIKKATGKEWKGWLSNRPGIKADEIEYTGLDDFLTLNQDKPLTRNEVLSHVQDNAIQIVENSFGDDPPLHIGGVEPDNEIAAEYADQLAKLDNEIGQANRVAELKRAELQNISPDGQIVEIRKSNMGNWHTIARNGDWSTAKYSTKEEATAVMKASERVFEELDKANAKSADAAKRAKDIRREILERSLQKVQANAPKPRDIGSPKWQNYLIGPGVNYREIVFEWANPPESLKQRPFAQAHHERDNVLAHARVIDRQLPDGNMAVHGEELQSDWHQKGRDFGYFKNLSKADGERLAEIESALDKSERGLMDLYDTLAKENGFDTMVAFEKSKPREAKAAMDTDQRVRDVFEKDNVLIKERDALIAKQKRQPRQVPDAPFKKNWVELVLKRLILYAAEKGYTELLITPGVLQAERFDLTEHVDAIRVFPLADDIYEVQGIKGGDVVIDSIEVHRDDLPEHIGKKAAKQILENPTRKFKDTSANSRSIGEVHELSGPDLKIGGHGMIEFYDGIVVNFLNSFGKKYGAKVGTRRLKVDYNAGAGSKVSQEWDLHSFPIPETLREQAKKGIPLFQQDVVDVNAKDTLSAGPYTYTKMDTERRQRSEALRDAIEDLITKYTGGRAQMRWFSSISQKAGGKIHKVDGGFSSLRGLIIMALDAADMVGSAKHEALHFLKDRGLISDVEWDTLVRTALREGWMDKKYGGSKLTVRQRYAHLPNMLDILEEAIAEQFRAGRYDNFQGFPPAVRAILNKLRKFFDGVAKEARKIFGQEATAEDIFRAIESGEIGRRADVEKAKVETAAIMDAPQRSAPQQMKNQSTPEEDPLRVDRWAADDIAIAAEATDDSKRKDETVQDIEADSAILGAHLESMRQRGLLSQEDEADLLASNDTARMMEEQAAAYEAAGICEGEE